LARYTSDRISIFFLNGKIQIILTREKQKSKQGTDKVKRARA